MKVWRFGNFQSISVLHNSAPTIESIPGRKFAKPETINISINIQILRLYFNLKCVIYMNILGYRSGDPGSIPGTTKKKSSGSGTGSTQPREYN
jgi:hypothetical protein